MVAMVDQFPLPLMNSLLGSDFPNGESNRGGVILKLSRTPAAQYWREVSPQTVMLTIELQ